jgi:lysozyme
MAADPKGQAVSFTTAQINALTLEGVTTEVIRRASERLARKAPAAPAPAPAVATSGRKIGPRGVACIKHFEGCRLRAYLCSSGIWTIGWGNTFYADGRRVREGDQITQAEADAMFPLVLSQFERGVERLLGVSNTSAAEFGALVSFAYNVGLDDDSDKIAEGLGDSTLLRKHLAGDRAGAATEFGKWINSAGKPSNGLKRRRAAERLLYLNELPAFDAAIGYRP